VSDTLVSQSSSQNGVKRWLRIMHERGISRGEACTWMRHQLIVCTFIDRRVQLFVRLTDAQIVQYY
jgi:hypothetical protein